jgi:hypothetical protein
MKKIIAYDWAKSIALALTYHHPHNVFFYWFEHGHIQAILEVDDESRDAITASIDEIDI